MAGGKSRCCLRCGSYYTPTGSAQKYCPDCRLAVRAQQSSAYYQRQKAAAQANREVVTREASLRLLARVADWAAALLALAAWHIRQMLTLARAVDSIRP